MATIVNTPPVERRDSGVGATLGLILLIVLLAVLIFYGLPALRSSSSGGGLSIPSKIDVNVNGAGGR